MIVSKEENMKAIDLEWVELLAEAKKIGLTPEEIRQYILYTSKIKK